MWDGDVMMRQVSQLCLPGTGFTCPGGMKGWVDLGTLITPRRGVEPVTAWWKVRCPNHSAVSEYVERWCWCWCTVAWRGAWPPCSDHFITGARQETAAAARPRKQLVCHTFVFVFHSLVSAAFAMRPQMTVKLSKLTPETLSVWPGHFLLRQVILIRFPVFSQWSFT